MRIGINTGYCNVGTLEVTKADVYDYWRRGNVAARLESAASQWDLDEL